MFSLEVLLFLYFQSIAVFIIVVIFFFPLSKTEKAFDFRNGSMLFIVFLKL